MGLKSKKGIAANVLVAIFSATIIYSLSLNVFKVGNFNGFDFMENSNDINTYMGWQLSGLLKGCYIISIIMIVLSLANCFIKFKYNIIPLLLVAGASIMLVYIIMFFNRTSVIKEYENGQLGLGSILLIVSIIHCCVCSASTLIFRK